MRLASQIKTDKKRHRSLIVDSEAACSKFVRANLEEMNYLVDSIDSLRGLLTIDPMDYSLMVISLDDDKDRVFSKIEQFKMVNCNSVVLVTGTSLDPDTIVEAMNAGADDYLMKPFNKSAFTTRLRSLEARNNL